MPPRCVVTIYSINGTLIRQYNVDKTGGVANPSSSIKGEDTDAQTSIDWDLKILPESRSPEAYTLFMLKRPAGETAKEYSSGSAQ